MQPRPDRACLHPPRTDIEEITHKTGHFRRFPAFIQMLRDALVGQEGGSCVIDILTYADLQALKSGRQPASTCARAGLPPSGNNKRYVILTQTGNERCVLSPTQCNTTNVLHAHLRVSHLGLRLHHTQGALSTADGTEGGCSRSCCPASRCRLRSTTCGHYTTSGHHALAPRRRAINLGATAAAPIRRPIARKGE